MEKEVVPKSRKMSIKIPILKKRKEKTQETIG